MSKVNGEQVKQAMIQAAIHHVDHHECSLCRAMVFYYRDGDELFFDPSCYCCPGGEPEPRSWDDAADWINVQSNEQVRDELKRRFGLQGDGDQ